MRELIALGGLLVVGSAIMAALGFRGREQVVGIDLGTTFSVVALRSRDRAGNPTVTVLPDRLSGKLLLPSVVTYLPNGSILVGDGAVARRAKYPAHTVFNSKRFIGRALSEVEAEANSHPYKVVGNSTANGSAELAGFLIPDDAGNSGKWVSPVDVAAEVVGHIKKSVAAYLGYEIHRAVICVPAKFTQKETKATEVAFKQAGFKVMRVLDEPTAAAIAYGLHKQPGARHTLVYDMGGGTLDTSLLYLNGKSVSVLGVSGDDHLGGSDFDLGMQRLLMSRFADTPDEAVELPPDTSRVQSCDKNGLHIAGEAAKIALSGVDSVKIYCSREDGTARSITITRDDFEEACADLFDRSMIPVTKVLTDQMMTADDVHDVVLVGGASRMPKLRELLKIFFGGSQRLHTEIDPDITVAYGAANIVD